MKLNSLAFRLIAGAGLWSGVALLVGGIALAANFRGAVERNYDKRLILAWESLVGLLEVGQDGALTILGPMADPRFEQPFSGWYWQISVGGANLRSRSLWDELLAAPPGVAADNYTSLTGEGPDNQNLRIVARNVILPGADQPYTIMLAADQAEITQQITRFNTLLARSFGLLAFGLVMAMVIQVRVGLSPLRRVREALAAIRTGRAERLDGAFPAEIAPLAEELNELIGHNRQVLERSRTQVGNLAHALKTPLSVLTNEAEARPGPLADTMSRQARIMREQVDHYLSRARAAATSKVIGARTNVGEVVGGLARTLERIYADRNIEINTKCADGVFFRGERQDFEEMIGNLMDNACKWAEGAVSVTAELLASAPEQSPLLRIVIEDDGPGLAPEKRDEVLKRGTRLDESMPGSGLGLSIVTEIADLYGGRLSLKESETLGGLAARLDLPALD